MSDAAFQPVAPARGTFLVSAPRLLDPNFMHTVVLLCEHTSEGSFGLVVNDPAPVSLADLPGVGEFEIAEGRDDPLYLGGPVGRDTLQIIHRLGSSVPGALHVLDEVLLGGDPLVVKAALDQRSEGREMVRFILGYSGWGAGQLDAELEEGTWIVCPASEKFIFDAHPETLWRRILWDLGGPYAQLAAVPPDPSWN